MGISSLAGLPSRGLLTGNVAMSTQKPKVYVAAHETAPSADRVIKCDKTNILIRALTQNKAERKATAASGGGTEPKGKRPAESGAEKLVPAKRMALSDYGQGSSSRGGSAGGGGSIVEQLQDWSVDKLKMHLKGLGQPIKGKKEELIERIVQYEHRKARAQMSSSAV
mmetsp:Transcript_23701/g.28597  ORF Transcript_23701/g.28597 Transcript_23701/m.28597 type:complete len:167 (-) Transcript_23701:361-861(-)